MCKDIYIHIYMYIYMCTYMYIHAHVCACVCVWWCKYTHVYHALIFAPQRWEQVQPVVERDASAGNRTRVTSMATMYSTTRPLMPDALVALGSWAHRRTQANSCMGARIGKHRSKE